jgi:hypothetical protein
MRGPVKRRFALRIADGKPVASEAAYRLMFKAVMEGTALQLLSKLTGANRPAPRNAKSSALRAELRTF